MENWKDLNELYEVSSNGRVRSKALKNYQAGSRIMSKKEKILKFAERSDGYYIVNVSGYKHRRTWKVHQLVADVFLSNPKNLPIINHIDGNKKNNSVENLEWCTHKHNSQHAFDVLGNKANNVMFGSKNPASRKVVDSVSGNIFESIKAAATSVGINYATLRAMLVGKNKNKTSLEFYNGTN